MFALAAGKARTGRALGNPVLVTEGWVTTVDGILAGQMPVCAYRMRRLPPMASETGSRLAASHGHGWRVLSRVIGN